MSPSFPGSPLHQARQALQRGETGTAARLVDQQLALLPHDAGAHHLRGVIYLQQKQAAAAAGHLRKAVKGGAGVAALASLGAALVETGAHAEAEDALRRAARMAPGNTEIAYALGHLLRAVGKAGDAEIWLRKATALAPGNNNAWLLLGSLLFESGRDQPAAACFDAILERQPDNVAARYNKALVDQRLGRFTEAGDGYERCRARMGPARGVMLGLGACLQEQGRGDDALAIYRELLQVDRDAYAAVLRVMTTASKGSFDHHGGRLRALLGRD